MKTRTQFLGVMLFLGAFVVTAARADAAPAEKKKVYKQSGTLQSLLKGDVGSGVMEPVPSQEPVLASRSNEGTCSDADPRSPDFSVKEAACRNHQTVEEYLADKKAKEAAAAKKKQGAPKPGASQAKKEKPGNEKPAGGAPVRGRHFMTCSGADPSDPNFTALENACRNQ